MSDDEVDIAGLDGFPEDESLRDLLSKGFGKTARPTQRSLDAGKRTLNSTKRSLDQVEEKPQPPSRKHQSSDDDDEDSDEEDDDDDDDDDSDDDSEEYPISHEMVIKTHTKTVTSASLDPAGGRLISASMDGSVNLHDFSSMTPTTIHAFRTVNVWDKKGSAASSASNSESYPLTHVEFHPQAGHVFLCVGQHPQAKVVTREGDVVADFAKGDMYLRDMHHTKGHTSDVTAGTWHPHDRNVCITAGMDSTLRIWDVEKPRCQRDIIVYKSKVAGNAGRSRMTAVAWGHTSANTNTNTNDSSSNSAIVAASLDGNLVMYGGNGPFWRPQAEVVEAHRPSTWTNGIVVSPDGRMVVTQGGDDTIKLWDLRKFTKPLVTKAHPSMSDKYPMASIRYGPQASSILVGSPTGDLHILNPANLKTEVSTPVTPGSALISAEWHAKLNQIVTCSANGEVHVLYSPEQSTKGAVLVMSRAPKKRFLDESSSLTTSDLTLSSDAIIVPGAQRSKTKTSSSSSSRTPYRPAPTPFMRNQPDDKHIAENISLAKLLHEDPREALLRYADVAKSDPVFTKAWGEETKYAELSDEEPEAKRTKR